MTLPVAIPLRFGSRRFGRVQGSKLQTDGKNYTQPGCAEYWDGGTTFLVHPPWTDPDVTKYGFQPNALISGGQQDTYGKPLHGWLFSDMLNNAVWLIQPFFAGASTTFSGALSIPFDIRRFGIFDGSGERPKTSATATLSSWGQATPNIADARYTTCADLSITEGDLHLVSAKKDGSVAILMVSIECRALSGYEYSSMPTLRRWPIGFIGVTCTADPDGNPPTLSLSVLRDRATTLGTRSAMAVSGGLVPRQLCSYWNDVFEGTETFTQSVTGEILALWYEDDVLTEMVVNCTIDGETVCDTAVFDSIVGGNNKYTQHSECELSITWELAIGATKKASWVYRLAEVMDASLTCGTSQIWTKDITETLADGTDVVESYIATDSGSDYTSPFPTMPHVEADSGAYSFTLHGACRSAGDLWLDGYWFEDGVWHSMEFVRYAYNVIGLSARGSVNIRGPALAPGGKIARSLVGTGYYGAYNARTGEAVAGETTTVSYV